MLAVLIGVLVIPIYVGPRSPDTLLLGALLMGACGMGVFGIVRPISPNGFRPPLVLWAWVCLPRRRSSRIGYAGIYRCAQDRGIRLPGAMAGCILFPVYWLLARSGWARKRGVDASRHRRQADPSHLIPASDRWIRVQIAGRSGIRKMRLRIRTLKSPFIRAKAAADILAAALHWKARTHNRRGVRRKSRKGPRRAHRLVGNRNCEAL